MFVMGPCVVVSICTNIILSVVKICSHQTHTHRAVDIDINLMGPLRYGLRPCRDDARECGCGLKVSFEREAVKEGVCTPETRIKNAVGGDFKKESEVEEGSFCGGASNSVLVGGTT